MNAKTVTIVRALLLTFGIQLSTGRLSGQLVSTLDQRTVKGTFYVSVDDRAEIYVNGTKVHVAGWGESQSHELELKTGDRLLVQLSDYGGDRHFSMLFASTDGSTILSFRSHDFKIVPDLNVIDFSPTELKQWTKYAKQDKGKSTLPIKSASELIWGEAKSSIIAGIVTPQMFAQRQGPAVGVFKSTPTPASTVAATPAPSASQVVIISATYGAPETNRVIDVKKEIVEALAAGSLTVKLRDSQEGGTGGVDPAPNTTKQTTITYMIGGKKKAKGFPEGHVLRFKEELK